MALITPAARSEILGLIVGMFNAAPGNAYLNQFSTAYESGATISGIANTLAKLPIFNLTYPSSLTAPEFADKLVANLLGSEVTDAAAKTWATTWVTGRLNAGMTRGDVILTAVQALLATTNTAYTNAKLSLQNKIAVSEYYSVTKGISDTDLLDLQTAIAGVTSSAATVTAAKAAIDITGGAKDGTTFTLTTGIDQGAAFIGTSADDTFDALPGAANAATLTALDSIDGGGGTDTLNFAEIVGGTPALTAYALSSAATVKNIEILNYTVASDIGTDTLTADVSSWTGLKAVNANISGVDGVVTVTTKGNATSASVTGATTSTITDSATTDTLATVGLTDTTGLATIVSDAVTGLNLVGTTGGATITAAVATRALTVSLNNVTGGTVTDGEATTLNVNAVTTKSSGVTLDAAKATTVTVDAAVGLTVASLVGAAAKTITVKGAGAATLSALTTGALESIDASASTGGLTVTPTIGVAVAFTGGTGKDAVTIGATTKAITTGAGDDTVTVAAGALGASGSVDAGLGTDTLKFSAFANAVTASGATTFAPTVSGFERLDLGGANAVGGATVDLANLDAINYVTLSATNTETSTITGMTSGGTIVFKASQTVGKDATVVVTGASTGTADVLNVVLSKATTLALAELVAADVETINVTSTESATTLVGGVDHALELNANAAKSLVISGNAGVKFNTVNSTTLTSIDASGLTGAATTLTLTTAALAEAATIKGGAGLNVITASAAVKAVTYIGLDNKDTITIVNANNNNVTTAGGDDAIVTGTGADTISAGAGDDSITSGLGLDIVNVGTGNDTFVVSANLNGNTYATITGMGAGDKIDFLAGSGAHTFTVAAIALAPTAAFADFLEAASAGADTVRWFQYGGDTYVVQNDGASTSFENGVDQVVKLVGLVDLSTATIDGAATNVLTLA